MDTLVTNWNESGAFFYGFALRMLLQSGVLIVVLYALDKILRKRVRASMRYCIWLLVLAKLVLPTGLSFPTGAGYWLNWQRTPAEAIVSSQQPERPPEVPVAAEIIPEQQPALLNPSTPSATAGQSQPFFETAEQTFPPVASSTTPSVSAAGILLAVWLAGVMILSCVFLIRLVLVGRIIRRGQTASERCRKILRCCRDQMEIRRAVVCKESNQITSPAVCGLFRPTILIPKGLEDNLTDQQLRTILLHELCHIQRGDCWVNLVQTLLQIFYYYNLFVWLANHSIRRIREQANDERVLVYLGGRHECYSHTLIEVAQTVFQKPLPALRLIGVMETKNRLNERIQLMIKRPVPKTTKLGLTGALAIILLACILLPMAQGKSKPTAEPETRVAATDRTPSAETVPARTPQSRPVPRSGRPGPRAIRTWNTQQQDFLSKLKAMDKAVVDAFNDGNVNQILSLFTEDGIRLPNEMGAAAGREALTDLYLKIMRQNAGVRILDLQFESREFWTAGDLVFVIDQFSVAFKAPSMRFVMTDYHKDLFVVQRQPGGSYKMVVGADSLNPAPANPWKYKAEKSKEPSIVFHDVKTKKISDAQMVENIETVKALDIEFHKCFIRHDAQAALEYYSDDTILLPLKEEIVRGKKAVSNFIINNMDKSLIDNNQQIIGAGGTDTMIYIANKFTWEFQDPNNSQQTHSIPGKGIHVWQKQPDGNWKLFMDIYNVSMPLPES